MIARKLGLPVLLGYIIAGVVIGPYTPGPIAASERVDLLANLGVGFLMFALGVEFSLNELVRVKRIAMLAGGFQIPATIVVGFLCGSAFGWSWQASLLLGGAFAISSSIVAIKLLMARGEGNSPQARITLGIGVIQDLSLVVMIAFGAAYASEQAGLSLALGAFLAGLIVSESEYDAQVLADVIPFRDLFSIIFFVSIGMLVDPIFLWAHILLLLAGIAVLIVGKTL